MNLQTAQKKIKDLASRIFQKNKYERVLKDYLMLAESRPNDMRVRLKIAETYFKTRDIEKAIETYLEIGEIYTKDKFILKAVAVYKNILKLDPNLVDINLKQAELYLQLEMTTDAINQYRIAMQYYGMINDKKQLLEICLTLVKIDPSPLNRRKLAEIYQMNGMSKEALDQYELLAAFYKKEKRYEELLHIYELVLSHKPEDQKLLRDICILYLRNKDPNNAIRVMERYKLDAEPEFSELYDKARLMKKMLRNAPPALKTNPA